MEKKIMRFMYVNSHILAIPFPQKKNTGNIPGACCNDVPKLHFFEIKGPGKFWVFHFVKAPASLFYIPISFEMY